MFNINQDTYILLIFIFLIQLVILTVFRKTKNVPFTQYEITLIVFNIGGLIGCIIEFFRLVY